MANARGTLNRLYSLRDKLQALSLSLPPEDPKRVEAARSLVLLVRYITSLELAQQSLDIATNNKNSPLPGEDKELLKKRVDIAEAKIKTLLRSATRHENDARKSLDLDPIKKPKPAPVPPPSISEVKKVISERTRLIDQILAKMENQVTATQADMAKRVTDDFLEGLELDEQGNIKNTLANKNKIAQIDKVFDEHTRESGIKVVETIVKGVTDVLALSGKYYGLFTRPAELGTIMEGTKNQLADWLGITKRGGLVENGYLNRLLRDETIRNNVRDATFKAVVAQKGFFQTKKELREYIAGNKDKAGALQQYHRNYVYDTFSQVDRTQSKIIADKLKMNRYAIYEGGLIKTSRPFCRERNGKVFTEEEISKFDPPTAKPPNYNPFTDLGGYACRHHLNWIPEVLAFALRPELRNAA